MRTEDGKWKLFHRYTSEKNTSLGIPYLDRLYIVECPLFSILLQRIGGPDPSTDYHDHPWTFLSLILWGRYIEAFPEWVWRTGVPMWSEDRIGPIMKKTKRWINFKWAKDFHTIIDTNLSPVWSILFCGPRRREWGFLVDGQWVHFTDYFGQEVGED